MLEDKSVREEKRRYIRLDTVFPVLFRLESPDKKTFFSAWLQGFTSNLSKGGICLSVNNVPPDLIKLLKDRKANVSLEIELPIFRKPVRALARATWIEEIKGSVNKYSIGLCYEDINQQQNSNLMFYIWIRKFLVPAALLLILFLATGLILNTLINRKLNEGNKLLSEQLVKAIGESSLAKQKIRQAGRERVELESKIKNLQENIHKVEDERETLVSKSSKEIDAQTSKIKELNERIQELSKERSGLEDQLVVVQNKENLVSQELVRIDSKKATLEKATLDNMYKWVQVHQNPRTGLVMSFEGDRDAKGLAFTYDQALVAQAYVLFDDFDKAHKVLDFFKHRAKKKGGLFFNAYSMSGGEPDEYIVHSGPNIWLGIALAQYTYKTQDKSYFDLAQDIAKEILNLQSQDSEGGVRGGPDAEWFSTEHNVDAYAFFNMMYKITQEKKYLAAKNKILDWLQKHTYDSEEIPIKRGKGDSAIATDTYAWSIAAIGPDKLERLGMSPDRIMEFAENNCSVLVNYQRPDGQVIKIKGFDFAPERHLARGGVVSSEWTAQMVVAFKIMAGYYFKKGMTAKGRNYQIKADEYLASLGSMIISSPSPSGQGGSCLPYSTQEFVDTGHGWFTPKGKSTGSVAGTVYTIFAYYNYNPLELRE
jgi:hypothetical protein